MLSAASKVLELRGANVFIKLSMQNLIITYFVYLFTGRNKISTCEELKNWILSPEEIRNLPALWFALHGHWDSKENIS